MEWHCPRNKTKSFSLKQNQKLGFILQQTEAVLNQQENYIHHRGYESVMPYCDEKKSYHNNVFKRMGFIQTKVRILDEIQSAERTDAANPFEFALAEAFRRTANPNRSIYRRSEYIYE